ncbi:Scr1 family TA system antitoxin-like transcriptional regulator [Streptomyces sp. NPDC000594]|uniref:Scr1 family TA system antitoxin-like transcriptional regulator n=1 Tax=Streptomyces sp. NPDC000594 TaxID=3154261 RepID=UPI0033303841
MTTAIPAPGPEFPRRHPADRVPIAGTAALVTGIILRSARRDRELPLRDAATAAGIQAKALAEMEAGIPAPVHLTLPLILPRLLGLYGTPRADLHLPALLELLDQPHGTTLLDAAPGWYERLTWCESEAQHLTVYSATTLPHPVHTPEYSRIWWQGQIVRDAPPPDVVDARRRRAEADDDCSLSLLLEEPVLWRHPRAARATMAAQLGHLTILRTVDVRIVSLGIRAFPAGILTALSLGNSRYLCAEETSMGIVYSTGRAAAHRDDILTAVTREARSEQLSASLLRSAALSLSGPDQPVTRVFPRPSTAEGCFL